MSDIRQDLEELLPFYVNGSLSPEEQKRVEQALAEDPSIQKEIDFLEQLRAEVRDLDRGNSPGEFGLKRLQKALKDEQKLVNSAPQTGSAVSGYTRGWRLAAIAACLLLLLQTAVTLPLWQKRGDDLIAAGGGTGSQLSGQIISVTFVPEAREENIRNLLLAVDASIVEGPSALGVYRLSVAQNSDAVVEKLLAHRNLVETAQNDSSGYSGRKAGQ
ncbi:hypothetical protein O4H49_03910 [Kiloniella laminariae]|uniref:Zinc-finger domain-containing protein n=1 Tax=Kiloniella laminariae TaxID=454162 RepID=A0ABT4LFP5_9PROT|nr:hypothetical protein [Kiloniella laminariae]MCZ4279909.1 hypothetical protein [Kiloniella laminariae]